MRAPASLLAVTLVACGGASPSATPATPATPAPAPAAPPAKAPPTEAERIAAAMARLPAIAARLASLRERSLAMVPAGMQGAAEFRAFVEAEVAKTAAPDGGAALGRALAHLGFLAQPMVLDQLAVDAAVTQAAAYYDPAGKAFHVVVMPGDDASFDLVSAHELTHALQDQHFDLTAFLPDDLSEDAASARRFLVEGEATLLMLMHALAVAGVDLAPGGRGLAMLGQQVAQLAAMSPSDIAAMMAGDPAAQASMAEIPPYVLTPMFDAYMKGAFAVLTVYRVGGWPAVDALYATPPASTEQMLHPVEQLACARVAPIARVVPVDAAGKGWTSIGDGTAGELGVAIWAGVGAAGDAAAIARGWGGDAWRVWERGEERLGLWATAWDSDADAAEFAAAATALLKARGGAGVVRAKGTRVDLALGCAAAACTRPLDALARAQPAPPTVTPRTPDEQAGVAGCVAALTPTP